MNKHTHRVVTAALAVGSLAALTACSGAGASSSDTFVGMSSPVLAQEGQKYMSDGFAAATQELGWDSQVYDANLSADTQFSNIQTMVDRQASAVAAWALDDGAIAGAYANASASDIPVIGINSAGSNVTTSVWWEVNTCNSGGVVEQLADTFAEAKPGGKIAVVGGPPVPSIVALTQCFVDAATAAGLTIVSQQDNTQDTSAGASALAQDMLSANPEIEGFWTYNDASALGVSSVLTGSGRSIYSPSNRDGLVVTGVNGDASAISAVRSGTLSATVDTDPVCSGWAVAGAMRDAQDGTPPEEYVVASSIVDGATIADYVEPAERTCSLDDLPLVG
ncbi:sugar ABC transporter substrate-binding protein [Rhodococcus sp. NPDC057297]|uniref:sugar ABC transporter substrate-binding protein n=1 Tax=Rhodococcus sp. NPDC057297 TaxID=3346090 RepID=UPI00363EC1F4